jgi:hypothetical protein
MLSVTHGDYAHHALGPDYLFAVRFNACACCDTPFPPAATLFMVPRYVHAAGGETVPICESCLVAEQRERAAKINITARCSGCGRRMVACVPNFRRHACSARCAHKAWRRHQHDRIPIERACIACGRKFTGRAHACYCSNALLRRG